MWPSYLGHQGKVESHVGVYDRIDDVFADLPPLGRVQPVEEVQPRFRQHPVEHGQVVALQHAAVVVGLGEFTPCCDQEGIVDPCQCNLKFGRGGGAGLGFKFEIKWFKLANNHAMPAQE